MTQITHSYNVVNKGGFEAKLAKIISRYKVETEVVWGEPSEITHEDPKTGARFPIWHYPVDVTFSFGEFKIEGYSYLGCIKDAEMMGLVTIHGVEHLQELNISEWVNSFSTIPCHACNRKHVRKIGHLFLNEETGKPEVFGSGCAKKYFGINFDRILSFYQNVNLKVDEWEEGQFNSFVRNHLDSNTIVKNAFYAIHTYGFLSKSASMNGREGLSTADHVAELLGTNHRNINRDEFTEITKDVDVSILWNKSYTKDSDNKSEFEHNIEVIQEKLKMHSCTYKDLGWVSYMVYNEFFKVVVEKKEWTLPENLEVGKAATIGEVKMIDFKIFDTRHGTGRLYTFEQGNVRYKWFTSISLSTRYGMEVGDTINIKKATIKDLENDPTYGKAVLITRASVNEI